MNKAIFLDRDGTVIYDVGYPKDPNLVGLLPNVIRALKILIDYHYQLILISNQSGIGRGIITLEEMNQVNDKLVSILKDHEIYFTGIYYCPHSPEERCNCRKPNPKMIECAAKDLKIDLSQSFMIGDRFSDIEAGKRAGCKTILLGKESLNTMDVIPDFIATDWQKVPSIILSSNTKTLETSQLI